jgi:hypothetical protein
MSERRRLAHINHKFAALGVVGAVMVVLPTSPAAALPVG